jgi:hypothetical protein
MFALGFLFLKRSKSQLHNFGLDFGHIGHRRIRSTPSVVTSAIKASTSSTTSSITTTTTLIALPLFSQPLKALLLYVAGLPTVETDAIPHLSQNHWRWPFILRVTILRSIVIVEIALVVGSGLVVRSGLVFKRILRLLIRVFVS